MRPVRNAFLDFQLTALFDKIIPIPLRAKRYKRNFLSRKSNYSQASQSRLLLFAQTESLDKCAITIVAAAFQVIEQLATAANHTQ